MDDVSSRYPVQAVADACRTGTDKIMLALLATNNHSTALEGAGKDGYITSEQACREVVAHVLNDEDVADAMRALKDLREQKEEPSSVSAPVAKQTAPERNTNESSQTSNAPRTTSSSEEAEPSEGAEQGAGQGTRPSVSHVASHLALVGRGRSQDDAIARNGGYAFLGATHLKEDTHVWLSNLDSTLKSFLRVDGREANHLPPAVPMMQFVPRETDKGLSTRETKLVDPKWSRALVKVSDDGSVIVPGTKQPRVMWADDDLDAGLYTATIWEAIPTDVEQKSAWKEGLVVRPTGPFRWDGEAIDNADAVQSDETFFRPLVDGIVAHITKRQANDALTPDLIQHLFARIENQGTAFKSAIQRAVVEALAEADQAPDPAVVGSLLESGSVPDDMGGELLHRSIRGVLHNIRGPALDLETDGEEVWEVGLAGPKAAKTYADADVSEGLTMVRETEVDMWIGHNLQDWDLKALRSQDVVIDEELVWDTLRYEAFLSPRRPSLALDTTHRAGEDADVAYRLYRTQVIRILLQRHRGVPVANASLLGPLQKLPEVVREIESLLRDTEAYHEALRTRCEEQKEALLVDASPPSVIQRVQQALEEVPSSESVLILYPRPLQAAVEQLRGVQFLGDEDSLHQKHIRAPGAEGRPADGFTASLATLYRKTSADSGLPPTLGALSPWARAHFQEHPEWIGPAPGESDADAASQKQAATRWAVPVDAYRRVEITPPDHGIVLAPELCRACSHSVVATFEQDVLDDFVSRNHLWAQFDGAGSYCQLSDDQVQQLDSVASSIPEPATAWLQRTSQGTYAIHAVEPHLLPSIRNALPDTGSWMDITLEDEPVAEVSCVRVDDDRDGGGPFQQRLNPQTRQRSRYWTVQALLLDTINRGDGNRPTVLLTQGETTDTIASFLRRLQWYIPEGGSLRRRLELVQDSTKSRRLVVVSLSEWASVMVQDIDMNVQLVVESLPIKEQQALRRDAVRSASLDRLPAEESGDLSSANETEEHADEEEASEDDGTARPFALQRGLQLISPYLQWLAHTAASASDQGRLWVLDPRVEPIRLPGGLQLQSHRISAYKKEKYNEHLQAANSYFASPVQGDLTVPDDWKQTLAHVFLPKQEDGTPNEFYESQTPYLKPIVERNSDVLVELPTGSGKSVLFQAPALYHGLRRGVLTIVVTPLKALMVDQAHSLYERGFLSSVEYVNGDLPYIEIRDIYRRLASGEIAMLYVAPERFRSRAFMRAIRSRLEADGTLGYFVFDEAHTVSLWGLDFRPDFLRAANFVNKWRENPDLRPFPCLMLSATITEQIYEHLDHVFVDYQAEPTGGSGSHPQLDADRSSRDS